MKIGRLRRLMLRLGVARLSQAELDEIWERARERANRQYEELLPLID